MANQVDYRDPTPNNFPQDYDPAKVDPRVKLRSESIKHKQKGKHTREAMYQSLEIGATIASEAKTTALDTASRQDAVGQSQKDFEDRYDEQIAGNTDLNEVIDARDGFKTLDKRLSQEVAIGDEYRTTSSAQPMYASAILEVLARTPADTFNFAVNTDAHYVDIDPNTSLHLNRHGIWHVGNLMALAKKCDLLLLGGDNVEPYYPDKGMGIKDTEVMVSKLLDNDVDCDRFIALGNHDAGENGASHVYDGIKIPDLTYGLVITEDEFKQIYRTNNQLFGETRDEGSLYFYKDYADKKVRFITLMSEDTGDQVDSNGHLKYTRWMVHAFRQKQLQWFANTLMTTPTDYHVVVYGHAPLQADTNPDDYVDASGTYHDMHFNYEMLMAIIKAWISGTDYAGSSAIKDFEANVTAQFSKRGKGIFVGYFGGHYHEEGNDKLQGLNNIWMLNSLAEKSSAATAPVREVGTLTQDAETIVSIDTINRKIKLIGLGAATDRDFDY
ncbi:Putative prophage lcu4 related protein [Latilactobacillus curvatus]|uniref:metallophosphoesterase n=1 Tax=Latilactobacillus curvatus TaxID=28038 RepID=UPI000A1B3A73|nr:metallophosphoesterase [Latilactobacillus curvatus]SMH68994.1 Putative prophage lcu4 related protein [Latilactobacillus curvatus]